MIFLEPYEALLRVYRDGAHLKLALGELPSGAHARTVRLVYGVLERENYLTRCIETFAKLPKLPIRIALKLALTAMFELDMPRYAAANEAVELVKYLGKGGAAGFVNAFLRNFDETKVTIPEGVDGLILRSNFPRFAVEEIVKSYGERAEKILTAKSGGVSVRFVRGMKEYLALPHRDTPFPDVKLFENFVRGAGYDRGDYTFQSVGSVAVCAAVEPCERLLDACAAPGGKAVLLAEKCGEVVACDVYPHRVSLIESYARRMNAENVRAALADAAVFHADLEGAFDAVLCDVPCSGLGTAAENPDLPLKKRAEDMPALRALQRDILANCAKYVKRGGRLYYATCSILPSENDGAVGAFLAEGGYEAERIESPLPHEKTAYGVQFLPDTAFGAGFYVSKMRRR